MDIHVGNLSATTTPEDLRKAFAAHGTVSSVTIQTEERHFGRKTGTSLGYGFVTMPDNALARAAVAALDRRDLQGSPVTVKEARRTREFRHRR